MTAEATGAREALDLTEDEVSVTLGALEDFAHAVGERVGAIACEPDRWHRTETIQANATLAITAGCVIAKLTSMFSRSAEEGLGAGDVMASPDRPNSADLSPAPAPASAYYTSGGFVTSSCNVAGCPACDAPQSRGTAPPSDDPPAGGTPVLPSCECGHREARHRTLVADGCRDCPCTEYEARTPTPSPTASPEAQETADGRVWTLILDKHGCVQFTEAEHRAEWQCEVQDTEYPEIAPHSAVAVIPRSELARVQRERDEYRACYEMADRCHRDAALRVIRQARIIDTLTSERDAALDRARVAEQRIENGDECWHFTSPSRDVYYPYNVSSSDPLGRCTRGRFVADQEGT